MQQDLFDENDPKKKGHRMAKLAAEHADRESDNWSADAIIQLTRFLRTTSKPFLVEEIRHFAIKNGLQQAPDERAWGHIIKYAQKNELVEPCGTQNARSSNGSPKVLWKRTGT